MTQVLLRFLAVIWNGTKILKNACLEIIEELGVKPEIGRLLYVNKYTQEDGKHYIEFFFEVKNGADYLSTEKLAKSHAFEIAEIVWVNPTDEIRIMPKSLGEDFKAGKVISDEIRYIKD